MITGNEIRKYAQNAVTNALTYEDNWNPPAGDPNEGDYACASYKDQCNPRQRVSDIRAMLERPHRDDSLCAHPVWEAVDAVLNHALTGIEHALKME